LVTVLPLDSMSPCEDGEYGKDGNYRHRYWPVGSNLRIYADTDHKVAKREFEPLSENEDNSILLVIGSP
jgi:hypothetical protein